MCVCVCIYGYDGFIMFVCGRNYIPLSVSVLQHVLGEGPESSKPSWQAVHCEESIGVLHVAQSSWQTTNIHISKIELVIHCLYQYSYNLAVIRWSFEYLDIEKQSRLLEDSIQIFPLFWYVFLLHTTLHYLCIGNKIKINGTEN